MTPTVRLLGVSLLVPVLVSCGDQRPASDGPPTASAPPATAPPAPTAPPATPSAPPVDLVPDPAVPPDTRGAVTVTGPVASGVEAGCLVLTSGSTTYVLLGGDPALAGRTATVSGTVEPETVTICQQGVPLRVDPTG